jgi:hypothetical protein
MPANKIDDDIFMRSYLFFNTKQHFFPFYPVFHQKFCTINAFVIFVLFSINKVSVGVLKDKVPIILFLISPIIFSIKIWFLKYEMAQLEVIERRFKRWLDTGTGHAILRPSISLMALNHLATQVSLSYPLHQLRVIDIGR